MKNKQKKLSFDIKDVLKRVEKAIERYAKAALFDLAEQGHLSVYEQAIACLLSVRTRDEVTLPVSLKLFELANTPEKMLKLPENKILESIRSCTFPEQKLHRILEVSRVAVEDYQGNLPCDEEKILDLPGIGPKCANLILGIACAQKKVSVDIHVHRVTNRWGYVQSKNPVGTMRELEKKLPYEDWIRINALLVPFGKHICRGGLPLCSTCPVLVYCQQVGVKKHL